MVDSIAQLDRISLFMGPEEEIRTERCESSERLLVITEGHYSVDAGRGVLSAGAGDVVYTPRGLTYTEWSRPRPCFRCFHIIFRWPDRPESFPVVLKDAHGMLQIPIRRLIRMHETDSPNIRLIRNYCLQGLLGELLGLWDIEEDVMVERVRHFVRQNLSQKLRLDDLARVAGLSRYHFARTYRGLTGRPPMSDVRWLRMEAARDLIINTDLPLKAIAPKVGMANVPHLSSVFHKTYNVQTSELRASRVLGRRKTS